MEWLIGLAILALIDLLNNREIPDLLVYLYFAYGFFKAILLGELVLFFGVFAIVYILAKIGMFGSAEAYIIPVLAIHGMDKLTLAIIVSIILANLYLVIRLWNKLAHKWMLAGVLLLLFHPVLGLVPLALFMLLNANRFKLYRIIDREKALDEYSPEFGHITSLEKLPKKIRVRDSIPYLPFLFLGYLVELLYLRASAYFIH